MELKATMSLQTEKINIAKLVLSIENKSVLKQVKELLNATKSDWWDGISKSEKTLFEEGIKAVELGKTKPHKEVMKRFRK